ncbi:hypothetical protein [Streptomyces sp. SD15]
MVTLVTGRRIGRGAAAARYEIERLGREQGTDGVLVEIDHAVFTGRRLGFAERDAEVPSLAVQAWRGRLGSLVFYAAISLKKFSNEPTAKSLDGSGVRCAPSRNPPEFLTDFRSCHTSSCRLASAGNHGRTPTAWEIMKHATG